MQTAIERPLLEAAIEPEASRRSLLSFALTIFSGAFLLFQVQLLLGKYILPWFGGTPAVWTTCMLFFQVLLLGGYLYSHLLATRVPADKQGAVHRFVLLLSIISLIAGALSWGSPLLPGAHWRPGTPGSPVFQILVLLGVAVGLPYLCLSTTGPLLQTWFARSFPGRSPYRLYALSNLGSLLGLLSYPFLVEPWLGVHTQAWLWFLGFLLFAASSIASSRTVPAGLSRATTATPSSPASTPTIRTQALWFLLPAFASLMLLATTNLMCQEVAVVPFLWVLPLALYLLSFIICFDSPRWYRRGIFQTLLGLTLPMAILALMSAASGPVIRNIWILALVLFACCMVCHGELARLKPEPAFLTRFYLLLSAGGAAGGIFVALIAPLIFNGLWEFHWGLVGCSALALVAAACDHDSWWYWSKPYLGAIILFAVLLSPHFISQYSTLAVISVLMDRYRYYPLLTLFASICAYLVLRTRNQMPAFRRWNFSQFAAGIVVVALSASLWQQVRFENLRQIRRDRNFYGTIIVKQGLALNSYALVHGQILHGFQVRSAPAEPTLYYTRRSGVGRLLQLEQNCEKPCPRRFGMIGLGVGTLAAYGRPGDEIRFYEINPQVIAYSQGTNPYFTYIRDSAAATTIVPGDARLSLERELREQGPQRFDALVIDAFSGDAIPTHLLTQEALTLYLKHLRGPDSVIAFHVSNKALNLRPVLAALAAENHLSAIGLSKERSMDMGEESDWVLLSKNPQLVASPELKPLLSRMPSPDRSFLWTDDYSNLFRVLKRP